MSDWMAALAALSSGAQTMGQSMEENEREAERRKRQALQDAIEMLTVQDQFGLTPLTGAPADGIAKAYGDQIKLAGSPGIQMAGGGSRMMPRIAGTNNPTEQRDALRDLSGTDTLTPRTVTLGDQMFTQDPTATRESRQARIADRRAQAAARAASLKDYESDMRDLQRQKALKELEYANRPAPMKYGTVELGDSVYSQDKTTGKRGEYLGKRPQAQTSASDTQRRDEALMAAEAWWNDVVRNGGALPQGRTNDTRAQVVGMFNRMRTAHPSRNPRDIILSIYNAVNKDIQNQRTTGLTEATAAKAGAGDDNPYGDIATGAGAGTPPPAPSAPSLPPDAERAIQAIGASTSIDAAEKQRRIGEVYRRLGMTPPGA